PPSDPTISATAALDLRSRTAIHNRRPDAVRHVDQSANRRPAMITSTRTYQSAGALGKRYVSPHKRIEAGFLQLLGGIFFGLRAFRTDHTDEPLRHDAIQSRDKVVRLDTHVDEAADDVGHVVGVDGGKDEVAGKRRLNGDLGG